MELFTIDKEKCIKCRKCIVVCPQKAIGDEGNGCPITTTDSFRLCINCGYCVDICVPKAFNHMIRKPSFSAKAAITRYNALIKKDDKTK